MWILSEDAEVGKLCGSALPHPVRIALLRTKHSPTALKLQIKAHTVPVSDKGKVIPNERNCTVCPAM